MGGRFAELVMGREALFNIWRVSDMMKPIAVGQVHMKTVYPFALPSFLLSHLPPASKDGHYYLDVRAKNRWDGILVVNRDGMCIGIYVQRRIEEYPLPFEAGDIEDVRRTSLHNRLLAAFPFDAYSSALIAIMVLSPLMLLLGFFLSAVFYVAVILACVIAIHVMYLGGGFPFTRFPVAMIGIGEIILAAGRLLRHLLHQ